MSHAETIQTFDIEATAESATKTRVSTRGFEFVVDEPPALGGEDDGPSPVEYLLGAWAGCLTVVVHHVAEERDIDVSDVSFSVAGDLDPRKLLSNAEGIRAGFQEIRVTIELESDIGAIERESFITEVEDRCPVGDTIEAETPTSITTTVA